MFLTLHIDWYTYTITEHMKSEGLLIKFYISNKREIKNHSAIVLYFLYSMI